MKIKVFLNVFGTLLRILGLLMLVPCVVAGIYGEISSIIAFAIPALLTWLFGIALEQYGDYEVLGNREGFALVAFGWLAAAILGALPYIFLGLDPVDALFESMSSYTTTGSTILTEFNDQGYWILNSTAADHSLASSLSGILSGILLGNATNAYNVSWESNITNITNIASIANTTNVTGISNLTNITFFNKLAMLAAGEDTYYALLFWRSFAQWLGGMGIIVLFIAILPKLGIAGRQLFKAEVSGPTEDLIRPRIRDTAKLLWYVYVVLTALEILLLALAGMPLYDSICNTFSTMACGGFSPMAKSIAAYNNPIIEYIIILFMFLSGANFVLHYKTMYSDKKSLIRDPEFRFYTFIITISILIILLFGSFGVPSEEDVRAVTFQVISMMTTTGFTTADYDLWTTSAKLVIFSLVFIGACAGSTAGGIKVVRILILLKLTYRELIQSLHPKAIMPIRLGESPVKEEISRSILIFIALYLAIFSFASLTLASLETLSGSDSDIVSTTSAVAVTLGNVGPGFGDVGPTKDFSGISPAGKLVLVGCMWIGRLEILTVLVLLLPDFWKR